MSALYRVICRACGWTGLTRFNAPGPKHRCPNCRAADLTMDSAHK